MTIRNRNDVKTFVIFLETNDILDANCKQVSLFKNGKIFIVENKKYSEVAEILRNESFEIANIY